MQQTLTDGFYSEMERFFTLAKEQGVERVTIDCRRRTVNVSFGVEGKREDAATAATDGGDVHQERYKVMYAKYMEERRCEDELQRMKDKALTDLTRQQLLHLIGVHLERLLRSGFLITEDYFFEPEQLAVAEQLDRWHIRRDGYEQKFALLCQMLTLGEDRLEVNELAAGKYMFTRNDSITPLDMKLFFRFVGVCRVVHREVRGLTADSFVQLSGADSAILARVCKLLRKGEWQLPATSDNVALYISTLFGDAPSMLDAEDKPLTCKVRGFFKTGRGDRVVISTANIVGYLMRHQLIGGGASGVSKAVFADADQVNNINKGKDGGASAAFTELEPLLDKYRKRIIGE